MFSKQKYIVDELETVVSEVIESDEEIERFESEDKFIYSCFF